MCYESKCLPHLVSLDPNDHLWVSAELLLVSEGQQADLVQGV